MGDAHRRQYLPGHSALPKIPPHHTSGPHFIRSGRPNRASSAADLPSTEKSPDDHTVREELARTIQAGLDSLPEEQRLAVLLVDVQGMDYEKAASAMDFSLGTVKSRLSRGRGRLRDLLRNTGELLPDLFRQEV